MNNIPNNPGGSDGGNKKKKSVTPAPFLERPLEEKVKVHMESKIDTLTNSFLNLIEKCEKNADGTISADSFREEMEKYQIEKRAQATREIDEMINDFAEKMRKIDEKKKQK